MADIFHTSYLVKGDKVDIDNLYDILDKYLDNGSYFENVIDHFDAGCNSLVNYGGTNYGNVKRNKNTIKFDLFTRWRPRHDLVQYVCSHFISLDYYSDEKGFLAWYL